jgi:hypothetical protein
VFEKVRAVALTGALFPTEKVHVTVLPAGKGAVGQFLTSEKPVSALMALVRGLFLAATLLVVRGLLLGLPDPPGASLAAHGLTFPIGPKDPVKSEPPSPLPPAVTKASRFAGLPAESKFRPAWSGPATRLAPSSSAGLTPSAL